MYTLEKLEATLEDFKTDLKAAVALSAQQQEEYLREPNAALRVMLSETLDVLTGLRSEIEHLEERIYNYKCENGLDYENCKAYESYVSANGKPSLG